MFQKIKQEPVVSSAIESVGYDEKRKILEVHFRSGKRYRYLNVERDQFGKLLKADSVGSFFNREIKDKYLYAEIK